MINGSPLLCSDTTTTEDVANNPCIETAPEVPDFVVPQIQQEPPTDPDTAHDLITKAIDNLMAAVPDQQTEENRHHHHHHHHGGHRHHGYGGGFGGGYGNGGFGGGNFGGGGYYGGGGGYGGRWRRNFSFGSEEDTDEDKSKENKDVNSAENMEESSVEEENFNARRYPFVNPYDISRPGVGFQEPVSYYGALYPVDYTTYKK